MSKSSILRYILAGTALAGACLSGLLGVASFLFHRDDRQSIEIAARLVPFNPAYLSRLSGYEPERRTELLKRAAHLNPFSEQAWLQLGFDSEFHHADWAGAEMYYLRSAAVSHLFLPRWTLTNFYFRRQNKPAFMRWARAALEITPYSADPIFTEMWLVDPDHTRLASSVPDRPGILLQYFIFLMNAQQFVSATPIVERLAAAVRPEDAPSFGLDNVLGPALDRLIGAGYIAESRRMWSAMSAHRWIPFPAPTPDLPLTNGDFEPLYGHGFDWLLADNPGLSLSRPLGTREISIDLSGTQPESCTLLRQWIPVGAARHYNLQWKADTGALANPAGLTWHIRASRIDMESPDLLADHPSGWNFQTPAGVSITLLSLEYKRPLGQTPADGNVQLQSVTILPN